MTKEELISLYLNKRIRIIQMEGEPHYAGRKGTVTSVDGIGQLHGTWGGCAIQPDNDMFEICK